MFSDRYEFTGGEACSHALPEANQLQGEEEEGGQEGGRWEEGAEEDQGPVAVHHQQEDSQADGKD